LTAATRADMRSDPNFYVLPAHEVKSLRSTVTPTMRKCNEMPSIQRYRDRIGPW
jgi:hypothetical protein